MDIFVTDDAVHFASCKHYMRNSTVQINNMLMQQMPLY